jgi:hypothetical protein
MIAMMIYAWAGISMALMWREIEQRDTPPVLLLWVALIWPVVPILWLIEVVDNKS